MSSSNNNNSGGVGILTVLATIFIVLKLVGVIDWSWWIVLMPVWIIPVIMLAIGLVIGIIMLMQRVFK